MNRKHSTLDKAAERLIDIDNVNHGDERERAIYMEAATFGMTLGVWGCFFASLVFAVFGQILLPIVLICVAMIPSYGTLWFASRRGVSTLDLLSRGSYRSGLASAVGFAVILLLTLAAMIYSAYFGRGLLQFKLTFEVVGDGLAEAAAQGALIGAGIGAVLGVIWVALIIRGHKRKRYKDPSAADGT